jgi:hypothetical protein
VIRKKLRNTSYYLLIHEKDSFLSHDVSGKFVHFKPPLPLVVQRVEPLRTCHAKSPMNTKVEMVLLQRPQYNSDTVDLKLVRPIPFETPICLY